MIFSAPSIIFYSPKILDLQRFTILLFTFFLFFFFFFFFLFFFYFFFFFFFFFQSPLMSVKVAGAAQLKIQPPHITARHHFQHLT